MSTQNGIRLTVPTSMFLYVEIPDTEKTDDRELIPVFNLNGTIDVAGYSTIYHFANPPLVLFSLFFLISFVLIHTI